MARYYSSSRGLTPGERVGASLKSRLLLDANQDRSFVGLFVEAEPCAVTLSLSEEATNGSGPMIQRSDGFVLLHGYQGPLSCITKTEGANEKQKLTLTNITGGTFTVTFEGKTTGDIGWEVTGAELETEIAKLTNIDATDMTIAGGAKGPWTITFEGNWKSVDIAPITVSLAKAEGAGKTYSVVTETPGGSDLQIFEG